MDYIFLIWAWRLLRRRASFLFISILLIIRKFQEIFHTVYRDSFALLTEQCTNHPKSLSSFNWIYTSIFKILWLQTTPYLVYLNYTQFQQLTKNSMRKVGMKEQPGDDNKHKDCINNDRDSLKNSTVQSLFQSPLTDFTSFHSHQYMPINYRQSIESVFDEKKNSSIFLSKYNNPSLEAINEINDQMNSDTADLSFFWNIWNSQEREKIIDAIKFIVEPQSWPLYRFQFEQPLELFLNLYDLKMAQIPFIKQLYPGLPDLIRTIQTAIEWKGDGKKIKGEQKTSDLLYQHYLKQIQSKNKGQGAFYIRDESKNIKIPIGDFIAQAPQFSGSHSWGDIFFRSAIHKKQALEKQQIQEDSDLMKERQNRKLIIEEIMKNQSCVLPADNHLCCAQFFYFNYRIYDKMISLSPVLTERNFTALISKKNNENDQLPLNELKQTLLDICALLNSGGGVILFNTFRNYLQIWPKGATIEKSSFVSARDLIKSEIRHIYPRVEMDREVIVTFVPVARNPIMQQIARDGEHNFIQGLYVMRIVVKPSEDNSEYIYFYLKGQTPFETAIVENNLRKKVTKTQISKLIKKHFKFYYVVQGDYEDEEQKNMIKKTYSRFTDHGPCLQPQKGLVMVVKIQKQNRQMSNRQLQQRYKYLTLLVASRQNYPVIQQRLRAKGIQCEISVKYNQYRFKAANNSAALFHNTRFDLLLNEVAYKKEFEFNGRFILTILVTNYIRLMDKNKGNLLPEDEFQTLQSWLKTEHPSQRLKLWRFQQSKGQYEFYIQTESKLSTLFMYYLLNHYQQKCQFKNPKDIERMTQAEKDAKMKLFYPRQRT